MPNTKAVGVAYSDPEFESVNVSANLAVSGTATLNGNLSFSGTGQRITGDMANTTEANRLMFQNSVTNGNTNLGVAPNGTATTGAVRVYGVSDVANSIVGQLSAIGTSEVRLNSTKTGTASFAPLTFYTNGSERMRIDTAGNLGVNKTAPDYRLQVNGTFGFAPGASVTPVSNGDVVIEATNNTTLTFKLKGSDGTVRSATLTLAP